MRRATEAALPGLLCSLLLWLAPTRVWGQGKIGIGSGLAYGTPLLGAGLEVDLGKYVAALGGAGFGNYREPWALGLRISFAPPDRKWRPHASFLHWTEGNGVYLGVDHDVGKPGGLVLTYGLGFGEVNLSTRVGVMIGAGYRF